MSHNWTFAIQQCSCNGSISKGKSRTGFPFQVPPSFHLLRKSPSQKLIQRYEWMRHHLPKQGWNKMRTHIHHSLKLVWIFIPVCWAEILHAFRFNFHMFVGQVPTFYTLTCPNNTNFFCHSFVLVKSEYNFSSREGKETTRSSPHFSWRKNKRSVLLHLGVSMVGLPPTGWSISWTIQII